MLEKAFWKDASRNGFSWNPWDDPSVPYGENATLKRVDLMSDSDTPPDTTGSKNIVTSR